MKGQFEIVPIEDSEWMRWGIRALDGPWNNTFIAQFVCRADAELWISAVQIQDSQEVPNG